MQGNGSLVIQEVAHRHFGDVHLHARPGVQVDGCLNTGNVAVLQTILLLAVAADIALHADAVDELAVVAVFVRGIGIDGLHQRQRGLTLIVEKHVVIVVEQGDIRVQLFHRILGAQEGILHVIVAHVGLEQVIHAAAHRAQMAGIRAIPFAGAVANGLVDHIPAENDPGIGFLKVGDHLLNVALGTGAGGLLIHIGAIGAVAFPEKPVAHIRIPHQHMAADFQAVLLRPFHHPVSLRVVHHRRAILGHLATDLVEQRVGLGFVGAGHRGKMALDEVHIGGIADSLMVIIAGAHQETIGLGQAGKGHIIILGFAAFAQRQPGGGQKGKAQGQQGGEQSFHWGASFGFLGVMGSVYGDWGGDARGIGNGFGGQWKIPRKTTSKESSVSKAVSRLTK